MLKPILARNTLVHYVGHPPPNVRDLPTDPRIGALGRICSHAREIIAAPVHADAQFYTVQFLGGLITCCCDCELEPLD